jgi:hypothetical protein
MRKCCKGGSRVLVVISHWSQVVFVFLWFFMF